MSSEKGDERRVLTNQDGQPLKTEVINELRDHAHVHDVCDVGLKGSAIVSVQFTTTVLPSSVLASDQYRIRNIWVGTVPPWYLRWVGEWCMRRGVGSNALAAELEVAGE